MTPNKTSRGRPKGTGLNDAAQLRAIAGLMATNPDLKPTTAIKTLGITDPSAIRRLRDKYSANGSQLIAEIAPQLAFCEQNACEKETKTQNPSPAPVIVATATISAPEAPRATARVLPLAGARVERKSAPVSAPDVPPLRTASIETLPRARRPSLIPSPSETGLPNWLGMGLSMYVLSVEAQFALVGTLFQWPPIASVMKSHVAFTELAVAMTTSGASPSRVG